MFQYGYICSVPECSVQEGVWGRRSCLPPVIQPHREAGPGQLPQLLAVVVGWWVQHSPTGQREYNGQDACINSCVCMCVCIDITRKIPVCVSACVCVLCHLHITVRVEEYLYSSNWCTSTFHMTLHTSADHYTHTLGFL